MTKNQIIEEIIKTYDAEMVKRYGAWLRRQTKMELEAILQARLSK